MATCKANGVKYLELPIALDAITLVVNPENTWASDITVPELAKIWQPEAEGKIENWSQIRQSWPDRPLNLYGPGEDSGTFDYFTQVIVGEAGASRKDHTKSGDSSILVDRVSEDPDGLGYVGLGHYTANWNRLDSLAVDNGQQSSQPTVDAVQSFKYQPLTRPLFIYVNAATVKNKPELQKFIQFYLEDVRKWVPFVGYVPLEKETINWSPNAFNNKLLVRFLEASYNPKFGLKKCYKEIRSFNLLYKTSPKLDILVWCLLSGLKQKSSPNKPQTRFIGKATAWEQNKILKLFLITRQVNKTINYQLSTF